MLTTEELGYVLFLEVQLWLHNENQKELAQGEPSDDVTDYQKGKREALFSLQDFISKRKSEIKRTHGIE